MANEDIGIWTLDWKEITNFCETIAHQVVEAELEVSMIVGVSRGGLIPATMLAHLLDVRRVGSFQLGSYEAGIQGAIQDLEDKNHLVTSIERAQNVLVVDDIVDSGATLNYLRSRFWPQGCKLAYAALTCKCHKAPEGSWPDFVGVQIYEPTWVEFPWEQAGEVPF